MKKTAIIYILMSSFLSVIAQRKKAYLEYKNNIQIELGGHGILYSFNYERVFQDADYKLSSLQIGYNFYPENIFKDYQSNFYMMLPISYNAWYTLKNHEIHHFEMGFGITPFLENTNGIFEKRNFNYYLSARLGYRFQTPGDRLFFRIGFTPMLETPKYSYRYISPSWRFYPWANVSLGFAF